MKSLFKILMILFGTVIVGLCAVLAPFVWWTMAGDESGGGTYAFLIIGIIGFIIGIVLLMLGCKIKSGKKKYKKDIE